MKKLALVIAAGAALLAVVAPASADTVVVRDGIHHNALDANAYWHGHRHGSWHPHRWHRRHW